MGKSSLRVYARRILGRRGVFIVRNVVSTLSFYLGVYDDPMKRPMGISAMVAVYNEEDWIEPSLLSIKDLVDEYVIIDSSTDSTPEIIARLKDSYGLNIKYRWTQQGSLSDIRNTILRMSSYRWILHWDGDFVLHEDSIRFIRNLIENLDPRRHYLIYWPWILLCGDIEHVCSNTPYHVEHWLFTYSDKLTYRNLYEKGMERDSLVAPLHLYRAIYIDKPLGVHLNAVKKPLRLAIKVLWHRYRSDFMEAARKGVSFEEYAKVKAREVYGVEDLEEVGKMIIKEIIDRNPRYDPSKYGELPSILYRYIKGRSSGDG